MVHVAPPTNRRRQLDLIVGAVLAAVGVAVLVVAVVALRQPHGHQAASPTVVTSTHVSTAAAKAAGSATPSASASGSTATSPAASSPTTSADSTTSAKAIPLVVLNNTTRTGLASLAAARFQAGGWTVSSTGNLTNDILSTCAYYDPSDPANQVAAAALQAQFPAIKRVEPKFDGLPAGPIVVVLADDYS